MKKYGTGEVLPEPEGETVPEPVEDEAAEQDESSAD